MIYQIPANTFVEIQPDGLQLGYKHPGIISWNNKGPRRRMVRPINPPGESIEIAPYEIGQATVSSPDTE